MIGSKLGLFKVGGGVTTGGFVTNEDIQLSF